MMHQECTRDVDACQGSSAGRVPAGCIALQIADRPGSGGERNPKCYVYAMVRRCEPPLKAALRQMAIRRWTIRLRCVNQGLEYDQAIRFDPKCWRGLPRGHRSPAPRENTLRSEVDLSVAPTAAIREPGRETVLLRLPPGILPPEASVVVDGLDGLVVLGPGCELPPGQCRGAGEPSEAEAFVVRWLQRAGALAGRRARRSERTISDNDDVEAARLLDRFPLDRKQWNRNLGKGILSNLHRTGGDEERTRSICRIACEMSEAERGRTIDHRQIDRQIRSTLKKIGKGKLSIEGRTEKEHRDGAAAEAKRAHEGQQLLREQAKDSNTAADCTPCGCVRDLK